MEQDQKRAGQSSNPAQPENSVQAKIPSQPPIPHQ